MSLDSYTNLQDHDQSNILIHLVLSVCLWRDNSTFSFYDKTGCCKCNTASGEILNAIFVCTQFHTNPNLREIVLLNCQLLVQMCYDNTLNSPISGMQSP